MLTVNAKANTRKNKKDEPNSYSIFYSRLMITDNTAYTVTFFNISRSIN